MSFLMSFLKKRFYVGVFLILSIALWSLPTTALADSGGATVVVNAGPLTEKGDFSQAKGSGTLKGSDTQTAYLLGIQVSDATGSGNGWDLQISGTPLSDGVNGHPALSQDLVPGAVVCVPGDNCTNPIATTFLVFIEATPQKFFSAAANSGMGSFDITNSVFVFVPGNAFAGTYTSTLTLAVVAGP